MEIGRVAVITGAASGIGYAAAEKCLQIGMKVCLADISAKNLESAKKQLAEKLASLSDQSGSSNLMAFECDVADAQAVERLKDAVYAEWGEVGFLFNNAGIVERSNATSVLTSSLNDWKNVLGVNVLGVVNVLQQFVPHMQAQETDCVVVNTGSYAGLLNASRIGFGSGVPYSGASATDACCLFYSCILLSLQALRHHPVGESSARTPQ